MSLINDALKQASQADKDRARPIDAPLPMTPAASARAQPANPLALGLVVIMLAVAAMLLFWRAFASRHDAPVTVAGAPPASVQAPVPASLPPPAPAATPVVAAEAAAVVAEPAFPALKLQAILFSKANPRAMINGHTVGVGDEIGGVRVKEIAADKVMMELGSQTKSLQLSN